MNDEFMENSNENLINYYKNKYTQLSEKVLESRKTSIRIDEQRMQRDLDRLIEIASNIDSFVISLDSYQKHVNDSTSEQELQKIFQTLKEQALKDNQVMQAELITKIDNQTNIIDELQRTFNIYKESHLSEIKDIVEYHNLKGDSKNIIMDILDNKLREFEKFLSFVDSIENQKRKRNEKIDNLSKEMNSLYVSPSYIEKLKDDCDKLYNTKNIVSDTIKEVKDFIENVEKMISDNKQYFKIHEKYVEYKSRLLEAENILCNVDREYTDCYREKSNRSLYANASAKMQEINDRLEEIKYRRDQAVDFSKQVKQEYASFASTKENEDLIKVFEECDKANKSLPDLMVKYQKLNDKISSIEEEIASCEQKIDDAENLRKQIQKLSYELNN